MPGIEPLRLEDLPAFEAEIRFIEARLGFVPNSMLTVARRPDILRAFSALLLRVVGPGKLRPELKQLVAYIASTASGCRYCQAHTASTAARMGVPLRKLEAAWLFETDSNFDDAERAALRLARDASVVPNATTPEHFCELRKHFSEDEIIEVVAMISMFGWLNRWNDTMATQLEDEPLGFASRYLKPGGWQAGKHGTGDPADFAVGSDPQNRSLKGSFPGHGYPALRRGSSGTADCPARPGSPQEINQSDSVSREGKVQRRSSTHSR
jgi:uncharacterized peroxidase-related enzyme